MSILDGKKVSADEIKRGKHLYIGDFRTPRPPSGDWGVYICDCGQHLWTVETVFEHWKSGHMDEQCYQTIEDNK